MGTIGVCPENFNPQILYIIEVFNKDKINTKYHCHDFMELSYVISGTGTYKINNEYFKVKTGDLLPFNPNVYHREYVAQGEELHELHIGIKDFRLDYLPKDYLMKENFLGLINLLKEKDNFFNCCKEIIEEQRKCEPGYDLILKTLAMKLMVIILRETGDFKSIETHKSCTFESSEKNNIVRTIISFMNENYMDDISLDKISRNMYLSPVYISKIFKEETGDSPINYLIKIRLEKASYMLQDDNGMSIKKISKMVGYEDAYYFSKLFKKYYGNSPLKFKQESHKL